MRIKQVRVQNFRGIKDSGWLYFDSFNSIVGQNDSGKSALLQAINVFFNISKVNEGDKYYGSGNEAIIIEMLLIQENEMIPPNLLDENGFLHIKKFAYDIGDTYKSYIIVKDFEEKSYANLFQTTTARYKSLFKEFEIDDNSSEDIEPIIRLSNTILNNNKLNSVQEYEVKSTILKNYFKKILPQYSLFVADTNLDTGTASFQNQFKKIVTDSIEAHLQEFDNLKKEVKITLDGEVKKIENFMKDHYPSMNGLKTDISYDWSKLINFDVLMKESTNYDVKLSNKGTGVQRLFMVAYFQYLSECALDESNTSVFAIEEPETFLHPGAQRKLLDSLKKISENHQIIITTHSPVFASETRGDNITVACKENGRSEYKQGEEVSPELLVDELGISASDSIVSSKLLIFVEGSNDIRFWRNIYKTYVGHDFEQDGILFLPGGGTELHNIAEMELMHKLNRNFMVIVDKDSGAVDYQEKQYKQGKLRKLVQNKGGNLIVLRKREIENYYAPHVVMKMLEKEGIILNELHFEEYDDVPKVIEKLVEGRKVQFKRKNNISIFENMTADDWDQVSCYYENDEEHFEMREIISEIKKRI